MKRAFKIILFIIAIVFIILLILWLLARHKAQENGTPAPSFKDFFTFTSQLPNISPAPNTEQSGTFGSASSSSLASKGKGASTPAQGPIEGTSQFTNGTVTVGSFPPNQSVYGNTAPDTTDSSTSSIETPPETSIETAPVCSTADSTITFTPDEIAKLNDLSQQFYTMAQTLHTDADVAAAQSAYDSFKVQDDQVFELNTYCQNQAPKIADPVLQRRVPTPFWYDPNELSDLFFGTAAAGYQNGSRIGTYYWLDSSQGADGVNSFYTPANNWKNDNVNSNTYSASIPLEKMLHLSLW